MAHHVREELWPHRINQFDVWDMQQPGQANYGAAKMGMLGLINVLAIEGASKNIRVNGLAPSAATRLITTIPGREDLDPENPDADVHPKLVTPAGADGQRRCAEWQDYSSRRWTLLNLRGLQ